MKDCTRKELEESGPAVDELEGVEFCLDRLFEDKKHTIGDEIVHGLVFEELIGVLLDVGNYLKKEADYERDSE